MKYIKLGVIMNSETFNLSSGAANDTLYGEQLNKACQIFNSATQRVACEIDAHGVIPGLGQSPAPANEAVFIPSLPTPGVV